MKCLVIHDNIFKYNARGLVSNVAKNSLFIGNYIGLYFNQTGINIENSNFERNTLAGVYIAAAANHSHNIKNSIFNNNTTGICEWTDCCYDSVLVENNNAFYENGSHKILIDTEEEYTYNALNSSDYSSTPYITGTTEITASDFSDEWENFSNRFYLPQDSALVDAGDPADGPMWGYTTDAEHVIIDDGQHVPKDIGYHYPTNVQSDTDDLYDYEEFWLGTNPANTDSDDDELNDYDEVEVHETDPLDNDTDDDSYSDGYEVSRETNPLDALEHPAGYPVVVTMNTSDSAELPTDAKWYLDGQSSTQYSSGQEVMVLPGDHTIHFVIDSSTPYIQPSNIPINITNGWINNYSATYNAAGWLIYIPTYYDDYGNETHKKWKTNQAGDAWHNAGNTIKYPMGTYSVSCESCSDHINPNVVTVNVSKEYCTPENEMRLYYKRITIFVDSDDGSDTSNKGGIFSPYKRIQKGLDTMPSNSETNAFRIIYVSDDNHIINDSVNFPSNKTLTIQSLDTINIDVRGYNNTKPANISLWRITFD